MHAWVSGRWVTAEPPAANAKPEVRPAPKPPEAPKAEAKVKTIKPPRAKRDKRTPMPAARAFWVPGHWTWDRADARYVWLDGRWVIEKPGMRWEDGAYHWVQLDDVRVVVWRSGHWVEVAEREPEPPPAVTVHELPDPPVGRRPARTGRADFWVDGHWEFDTSSVDYGWIAGEWKAPRAGHRRVGGRYEWATQGANRYRRWVPGAWLAVSTPRPDPTVATATPKPAPRVSRIEPPPAPRSRRPRQPSRTSFWIDGHWDWDRSLDGYRWTLGRWEQARRDARWVGGSYRWSRLDEARMVKTWLRGHWERLPAAEVATAPADVPAEVPPEPAAEVRAPRPSDAAVWLDGHFDWTPEDSRYVWTPGAWETPPEPDSQRVSGHYQWLVDNGRLVQAWREGTWSKEHAEQAAEAAEAPAGEEPPAAEPDEPESARPDATAFWVAGHWTWDPKDARYVWEGGRWIDPIEGESWIYGAYEWDKRNGKLVRIWQDGYFAPPSAISRPTPTQ